MNLESAITVKAYLDVSGVRIPIVDATLEFVVNQIPIARIQIPAGVKMKDQTPVNLAQAALQAKAPAQVVVICEGFTGGNFGKSNGTPISFEEIVFDGYVLAYSTQVSTVGVSTSIVLIHWLYDTDMASFASGDFDKNVPSDWFAAEYAALQTPDSPNAVKKPGGQTGGTPVEPTEYLDSDWWEDIIKPALIFKAEQPLTRFTGTPPSNNNDAIAAIRRVKSAHPGLKLNGTAKAALQANPNVLRQINEKIGTVIATGEGGASAFEKMVSIASMFNCVIVPTVNDCYIEPHQLNTGVTVALPSFDLGASAPNPGLIPAGCIIYGDPNPATLANDSSTKVVDTRFIGQFIPENVPKAVGPFVVSSLPDYMSGVLTVRIPDGGFKSKVGMVPLGAGTTPPTPPTAPASSELINFADLIARSHYFNRLYASRAQDVICPLSFKGRPNALALVNPNQTQSSGVINFSDTLLGGKIDKTGLVEAMIISLSASANRVNTTYRIRNVFEREDQNLFAPYLAQELNIFESSAFSPTGGPANEEDLIPNAQL